MAATNPLDDTDFLKFEWVGLDASNCVLQFTPRAGRFYAIESCDSPFGTWVILRGGISGTQPYTFTDSLATGPRFYRLRASLSP